MVKIYNKQTNEFLGRISDEQFRFLQDQLEEESLADSDYYLTRETLDSFESQGADENLVLLLRTAMKPGPALEIRWENEKTPD